MINQTTKTIHYTLLKQICEKLSVNSTNIDLQDIYQGLSNDSRKTKHGFIYFALQGVANHGIEFAKQAIDKGATLIISDKSPAVKDCNVAWLITDKSEQIYYNLLADLYRQTTSELNTLVAITGTNGKTTVAQLLAQALTLLDNKCATLGTAGNGFIGELQASTLTTMDTLSLYRYIDRYVSLGAKAITMEASSHGLEQNRLSGLPIIAGVFTNLTQDHLDYHKTLQEYKNAKLKLFQQFPLALAVINIGDQHGVEFYQQSKADKKIAYAIGEINDKSLKQSSNNKKQISIFASDISYDSQGMNFSLSVVDNETRQYKVSSSLIGEINAENLLAVIATLLGHDFDIEKIIQIIPKLKAASGRLESITLADKKHPLTLIDYAHTPDALEKVLKVVRDIIKNKHSGKLIVVFGCGGDRDKTKRPLMGKAAENLADKIIVTNDNPRTENHQSIIEDIIQGMKNKPHIIADRKEAIYCAIKNSHVEDIVLIAGKGHETGQTINATVHPFSDKSVAKEALKEFWL